MFGPKLSAEVKQFIPLLRADLLARCRGPSAAERQWVDRAADTGARLAEQTTLLMLGREGGDIPAHRELLDEALDMLPSAPRANIVGTFFDEAIISAKRLRREYDRELQNV